jgi:hypothetical protein
MPMMAIQVMQTLPFAVLAQGIPAEHLIAALDVELRKGNKINGIQP